jgi:hypothetical protein
MPSQTGNCVGEDESAGRPLTDFNPIEISFKVAAQMKSTLCAALLLLSANIVSVAAEKTAMPPSFDTNAAERFANLALACVHKEYPNKHSSVHGHWLLARLVRTFPNAPFATSAREVLRQSFTAENIAQEAAYLRAEGRASFERPYGLAWLLQLVAELREWDDPDARTMAANLRPLEEAALQRLNDWLPKLSYPVRIGEHAQTAFALGLMLDYARHGEYDVCRPSEIEGAAVLSR